MKAKTKFTLLLLSPLFALAALGQQDTVTIQYGELEGNRTETILANNPYEEILLHGSMILPGTPGQFDAQEHGLYLKSLFFDADTMDDPGGGEPRIDTAYLHDSTLFIRATITVGGCQQCLFDMGVENDTVINMLYYPYGPTYSCASSKSYYVTYQINLYDESTGEADVEEIKALKKIKWVMLAGDKQQAKNIRKVMRHYTTKRKTK
jgi:hypothetical protein